jgi:CrcB protein
VDVLVGGAFGSLARWGVELLANGSSPAFAWGTLAVNATGAFGLGLVAVVLTERLPPTRHLRPLVAIGFFGGYTTFSTMAVDGVRMIDAGRGPMALAYWIATLVAGQMAGVYGMWLGRLDLRPRRREER